MNEKNAYSAEFRRGLLIAKILESCYNDLNYNILGAIV